MTAAWVGVAILVLFLVVILVLACVRIESMYRRNERQAESLVRLSLGITDGMWMRVRAQVLRDAAEAWPTVMAQSERAKLSWTPQGRQGESSVVMWLNARADRIEGIAVEDDDD